MFASERPPEETAGVSELDLTGQTVLVTGSTNGIGRTAALALGRLGAEVFVHGRDEAAGEAVVRDIEATPGSARLFLADFLDPDAVAALGSEITDATDSLDALCLNAGGYFDDREETTLGVDPAFHVNHLAHYHLTADLLDVLTPGSRVVTTASIGHRAATLNIDRVMDVAGLSPLAAYCRSKLANILFANELARRLQASDRDVTSNSFHPGVIPGSEFGRAFPGLLSEFTSLLDLTPVTDSVEDGAATLLYLAVAPDVADTTGEYFTRTRSVRPAPAARDRATQQALWERSATLLHVEKPLADARETPTEA